MTDQDELDQKLVEILNKARREQRPDARVLIPELKQAFADEGYVHIPQVEIVTRYERGEKPELYMVNGKKVMTGQEWYDRFVREYHNKADWIAADETMGDDAEHDVLLCARLAARLE